MGSAPRAAQSRAPFREPSCGETCPTGRRYISVSGEPRFDARGRFTGYRGIGRDISHQQHIQQLLKLDQAVTLRLAEAHAPQALSGALEAICDSLLGLLAALGAGRAGRCAATLLPWATPGDAGAASSRRRAISPLRPAKAWLASCGSPGEPLWIADTTADPRALRSDLAGETGLRAAALFPIHAGGRVAAVLEITSRRMRQPDKRLWQTLGAIGTQIGQFLSRLAAERAVRESEARFRALTSLSSDWYWELDAVPVHAPRRPPGGRRRSPSAAAPARCAALGSRARGRGAAGTSIARCSTRTAVPRRPHVAPVAGRLGALHARERRERCSTPRSIHRLPRRRPRCHRREARRADARKARARRGAAARRRRGVRRPSRRYPRCARPKLSRAAATSASRASYWRASRTPARQSPTRPSPPSSSVRARSCSARAKALPEQCGNRAKRSGRPISRATRGCATGTRGGVPGLRGGFAFPVEPRPGPSACFNFPARKRAALPAPAAASRVERPGRPVPAEEAGRGVAARERGALSQPDADVVGLLLGDRRGAPLHPARARTRVPAAGDEPRRDRQGRVGAAEREPRRGRLGGAPRTARPSTCRSATSSSRGACPTGWCATSR